MQSVRNFRCTASKNSMIDEHIWCRDRFVFLNAPNFDRQDPTLRNFMCIQPCLNSQAYVVLNAPLWTLTRHSLRNLECTLRLGPTYLRVLYTSITGPKCLKTDLFSDSYPVPNGQVQLRFHRCNRTIIWMQTYDELSAELRNHECKCTQNYIQMRRIFR